MIFLLLAQFFILKIISFVQIKYINLFLYKFLSKIKKSINSFIMFCFIIFGFINNTNKLINSYFTLNFHYKSIIFNFFLYFFLLI